MSHGKRTIEEQARASLSQYRAYGQSRRADKIAGETKNKIYSHNTFKTYLQQAERFGHWLEQEKGEHNLNKGTEHIEEYIRTLDNKSAWTQATARAALSKLYQKDLTSISIKERHREDITKNRTDNTTTQNFSERNNEELVNFCKHTGLRRSELTSITAERNHIEYRDGQAYLTNIHGKGGRIRDVPILRNDERTIERIQNTETGRIWKDIPNNTPAHRYRAEYAREIYREHERPTEELSREETYHPRGDQAGEVYDKQALLEASQALGHSRIDVIVTHYMK